MSKTINRQSGFAIGTILLAVILIAAIVSAIAIASRGTTSQSNREGARVQASTLMQQGTNLKNGFDRMIGGGVTGAEIVMSDADANGADGDGNTEATAGYSTGTNCDDDDPCLFDPTAGGASAQNPPGQALIAPATAGVRYQLHNYTIVGSGGGAVGTAAGVDRAIILSGIRRDVCQQINRLAADMPLSEDPPSVGAVAIVLTADDGAAATAFEAAPTNNVTTTPSPEGCVHNGTAADGPFVYYKVMFEQ